MNIIFVSFFDLKRLVDANVYGFASSVLGNAPNNDDTGLFFSGEITATALVAFAALVLSVINLCWTVFRDTRRSKLRVRASVMRIAYPDGTTSEQFISIFSYYCLVAPGSWLVVNNVRHLFDPVLSRGCDGRKRAHLSINKFR